MEPVWSERQANGAGPCSTPDRTSPFNWDIETEMRIGMDLVRASEAAALSAFRWIGRGDKEGADGAATDAIRGMLSLADMRGTCTIGEGIKDKAPGIFLGERLGTWRPNSTAVSIALDPIDGTTAASKGMAGALSVIAAASGRSAEQESLAAVPSYYMDKIAVGPKVRNGTGMVCLDLPVQKNIEIIALKLNKRVRDVVVSVLDRPRNQPLIDEIRRVGATIRLVDAGDIAPSIAPSVPESGVDAYLGVGGSPEAVTAAAAIRCLGGEILARIWPRDRAERENLKKRGLGRDDLQRVHRAEDLAKGDSIVFVATGVTDTALLRGVSVSEHIAKTHSVIMRLSSGTVRYITGHHDLKRKRIWLHSAAGYSSV